VLQQQINQIRRFLSNAQTPDSVIAHLPKIIRDTHLHSFDRNIRLGLPAVSKELNLPIAEPIVPDPYRINEVFAFVCESFNVSNADQIPSPTWGLGV
jgi:hypothetical protein